MKTKFITTIVVSITFTLFANYAIADDSEVVVSFPTPLSYEKLEAVVSTYETEPLDICFQNQEIGGCYTIKLNESISQAFTQLTSKHKAALINLIGAANVELVKATKDSARRRYQKMILSLTDELIDVQLNGMFISRIRVINHPVLQNMLDKGVVEDIHPVSRSPRRNPGNDLRAQESSFLDFFVTPAYASSYYVDEDYWAPGNGTSETTQSMAYNIFYFPDASGFDSFGGIMTYEHETQIYNKNFADYDGYYNSNLPSHYYDTPFLDTIDNFTVGTSQASGIQDNTAYWTYMSLKPGSSSTADVIIKGQLGHRYPSWCYSTWCVYADMTTGWLSDYVAPNSENWAYTP